MIILTTYYASHLYTYATGIPDFFYIYNLSAKFCLLVVKAYLLLSPRGSSAQVYWSAKVLSTSSQGIYAL